MLRIAIIDKDIESLDATSLILEAKGYEVLPISMFSEVQKIISEKKPELIILDQTIQDLPGNSISDLRLLRNDIPVILVTPANPKIGSGNLNTADDFITTPFSPSELIEKIERLLQFSVQQ